MKLKIAQNIAILVAKLFLNSVLHKNIGHGWGSSIPSAFQSKTDHILRINSDIKLTSLFMRKYCMYLNCLDSSSDKPPIFVDTVDYGKHVSPSQVKLVNGKYKCIEPIGQKQRRSSNLHMISFIWSNSRFITVSCHDTNFSKGILAYQKNSAI
jgi:hypothetical protein